MLTIISLLKVSGRVSVAPQPESECVVQSTVGHAKFFLQELHKTQL